MRELRLIGVHDDGEHLLLADDRADDGQPQFTVPIDIALRTALKRAAAGPSAAVDSVPVPEELRPRDVQALLRAGASVADVAERAGWTTEKVERYEGPIRAEREHIAGLARAIVVSGSAGGGASRGSGGVRDDADTTFGDRVERRLDGRGVDPDDIVWDSWRGRDGGWTVLCSFPAGGRQRRATWSFDPRSRTLDPTDDEARWLGEDEGSAGPLSAASARETSVYDVEAEGGLNAPKGTPVRRVRGGRTSATSVPQQPEPSGAGAQRPAGKKKPAAKQAEPAERPVDLVAAMRERSKNRRRKGKSSAHPAQQGDDFPEHDFPEDAAPREKLDTTGAPPPVGSHPREEDAEAPESNGSGESAEPTKTAKATETTESTETTDSAESTESAESAENERLGHDPVTGTADLFADLEEDAETRAESDPESDTAPDAETDAARDDEPSTSAKPTAPSDPKPKPKDDPQDSHTVVPDRPSSTRKGRPSVPSWDDIMFGRRPGRD
ncbi:septation protein SepH [Flexivirga sp. B27]